MTESRTRPRSSAPSTTRAPKCLSDVVVNLGQRTPRPSSSNTSSTASLSLCPSIIGHDHLTPRGCVGPYSEWPFSSVVKGAVRLSVRLWAPGSARHWWLQPNRHLGAVRISSPSCNTNGTGSGVVPTSYAPRSHAGTVLLRQQPYLPSSRQAEFDAVFITRTRASLPFGSSVLLRVWFPA
ncbi:hypothetical protein LX36DRAFT_19455 [Colletotrichum falcatum]|nr:hypothetical protein LX36DRAFT_19455 [Colletotrichum falcatum]